MVITIQQRHGLHLRLGINVILLQINYLLGIGHVKTYGQVQVDLPNHHLRIREGSTDE
jgi:hypothetical protein